MRKRYVLVTAVVFGVFMLSSGAGALSNDPRFAHGSDGRMSKNGTKPGKVGLRKEVARLRAEVAQLVTQVNYMNRDEASPPSGGGAVPGWGPDGMCGDPCAVDSDDDGIDDCQDYCPCDPDVADTDGDGIPDCADACPDDATDACLNPCNFDSDGDGTGDCEDPCPWDPAAAIDADNDGTYDCSDPCPQDARNECFDPCRLDQDGDGVPDCKDPCPWEGPGPDGTISICLPPPVVLGP